MRKKLEKTGEKWARYGLRSVQLNDRAAWQRHDAGLEGGGAKDSGGRDGGEAEQGGEEEEVVLDEADDDL